MNITLIFNSGANVADAYGFETRGEMQDFIAGLRGEGLAVFLNEYTENGPGIVRVIDDDDVDKEAFREHIRAFKNGFESGYESGLRLC